MQNKKLYTRLFAVLACLILLVALAVPCFADEAPAEATDALNSFYDTWGAIEYVDNYTISMIGENIFSYSAVSLTELTTAYFSNPLSMTYGLTSIVTICDFVLYDSFADGYYTGTDAPIAFYSDADSMEFILEIGTEEEGVIRFLYEPDGQGLSLNNITGSGSFTAAFDYYSILLLFKDDFQFAKCFSTLLGGNADSVAYPKAFYQGYTSAPTDGGSTPDTPTEPTRSGMYGQLYNILKDAIYEDGADLDAAQEFTLTQISTWMTYIVILLPILVVAIILFRVFFR